ncbi:MAG: YchF/TatD family DNA exonuclease [Idiomarina sp.]|nr:YchF/TatD family DNA exonuclease [Idiomarina sp.]
MFVDSHCHLDKIKEVQTNGVGPTLARAEQAGVEHVLCVAVTLDDYPVMRRAIGEQINVSFSCGLHPLYMKDQQLDVSKLTELVRDPQVVAVGETGLDYFYDKEFHAQQQSSFEQHIRVACEIEKPLIIHTRDAHADTIRMLREGSAEHCGGVLHCFTESLRMAEEAMEIGFYISISGIVTFANADELRETVKKIPLERLLIETDSPWLAPVPHRGKENEPAFVHEVARCVAALHGVSVEQVAEVTTNNFYTLFNSVKKII